MHREDKPALIALALMLAAIIALAAIEISFRNSAANPPSQQSTSRVQESYQQDHGWEAHVQVDSMTDWLTVALTAAATLISVIAVRLVNETLKTGRDATAAAVEAVSVTRDIGERQLRPYIVYESAAVSVLKLGQPHPNCLEIDAAFRNAGASPGRVTATSCALYAPGGATGWASKGGSWQSVRAVIGQNQTEKFRFRGISADPDGRFSWFSIGILIWYESITGTKYEDHVWLTYDGTELRQGFPDMGHVLYRPEPVGDAL